jgi:hypothetical protein
MGALRDLIVQFAQDIEAVYEDFQSDKEEIGKELVEGGKPKLAEVVKAVNEVKATASEHFDEMMNLARTFVKDLQQLPDGEQPGQDLPSTGPEREPLPKPEPQE